MLRVLSDDVPMEDGQRDAALTIYKGLAIPGKDDCGCFPTRK